MTDYSALLARHQYAIVDCAHLFPEPWTESAPMKPLVPDELRSDAQKMPALLSLDPKRHWFPGLVDDLRRNEENAFPQFVANLLAVPGDVNSKSLARHLTSRLIVHFPKGKAYLKFFEIDTFVHLKRILNPAELQALYGSITEWTVYFQERWYSESAPGISKEAVPASWRVTSDQFAALDRIRLVNKVLRYWRDKLDRPWTSLEEFRAYADHADAILVRERQAQPGARDEPIVEATCRQFPQNFSFQSKESR